MNTAKKLSGLAIASAAAALFATGCVAMEGGGASSTAEEAKIHCMGVNACKGTSACATANNACKGHNACKGQGCLPMTKSQCEAKGGTVG